MLRLLEPSVGSVAVAGILLVFGCFFFVIDDHLRYLRFYGRDFRHDCGCRFRIGGCILGDAKSPELGLLLDI